MHSPNDVKKIKRVENRDFYIVNSKLFVVFFMCALFFSLSSVLYPIFKEFLDQKNTVVTGPQVDRHIKQIHRSIQLDGSN